MAIATISFLPQQFEYILWPFIFGFCAYSIAKHCEDRFFFHGFFLSIINCIYIVAFHTAFFETYAAAHEPWISMLPPGSNTRAMSAAAGIVIGIVSGIIQGLCCIAAAKMQSKSQTT